MRRQTIWVLSALMAALPVGAQQVKPAADGKLTVAITHRGTDAAGFASVTAEGASLRDALREVGAKAGVKVLMSPSVGGTVTVALEEQPLEKALGALAAAGGATVRVISVPAGQEERVTADAAAALYEALALLPANSVVTDPVTGKGTALQSKLVPDGAAERSGVYYVQGKLTPAQERASASRRETERVAGEAAKTAAASASPSNPDQFVSQSIEGLKTLTPEKRVGVMMDFMRQFQESMTPEERGQMRDAFRNYWQQNRPQGGPGGGPGGPPMMGTPQ